MDNTVNNVNVKYITKNKITVPGPDFLRIINQTRANIISSRNLRLIDTRVCIVPESGSFDLPRMKIENVKAEMSAKMNDRVMISFRFRLAEVKEFRKKPVPISRIMMIASAATY